MTLNLFFNPKTVAIIGASDHLDKVGGILLANSLKSTCKIVPVNPSHDSLFENKCYKSILDYSGKIDLAVIAIPAEFVCDSLLDCGKKHVKNVIVVSAGFSETGNVKLEKKLLSIAKKYYIEVLGPNCFGIFNSINNLDLTFSKTTPKKGKMALVSQSGAMWSFLADAYADVGFSKFVGLGNMSDLEFSDFIDYLSQDDQTESILLYVEKLKQGGRFIEVCKKAIAKGKRIYAIKAGSSASGSKAAFSHTGSLATDYEIYKGAFKQAGIVFCKTLEEAIFLASGKKLKINPKSLKLKKDIKIITNAGGAGVLLSDYLSEKGFNVLSSQDIIGTALARDYENAILALSNFNGSIFVILTAQTMSEIRKTADVCVNLSKKMNKQIIPLFLGGKVMDESNSVFNSADLKYFNNFEELIKSI